MRERTFALGLKDDGDRVTAGAPPAFSVVVPTFGRPGPLERCLSALLDQRLPAREVIAVYPARDRATASVVGRFPPVVAVCTSAPSNLEGMRLGAGRSTGEIICFTDDDARPRPDWLERLAVHFADPQIGAVGGRDVVPGVPARPGAEVGRVTRWGRLVGNHHTGMGPAREVDVLKGVNMAVRRELLAFPAGLLAGGGTTHHSEISIGLWIRARGMKVVYDPAVAVDHHPAPRIDGSDRSADRRDLAEAAAFNLVLSVVSLRPGVAPRRAIYGFLAGDRECPGLARAAVALLRGETSVLRRLAPSLKGQARAMGAAIRGRGLSMEPVPGGLGPSTD